MRIVSAPLLFLATSSLAPMAFAQSTNTVDIFLTKPVKDQLSVQISERFKAEAQKVGFSQQETAIVAKGFADQSLRQVPGGAWGGVVSSGGRLNFRNPQQAAYIEFVSNPATYTNFLERYATVQLDVRPIPPRDYKVVINGEPCEATERAVYRVLPGSVTVEVTRIGKPPCSWKGSVASGHEQLVKCSL